MALDFTPDVFGEDEKVGEQTDHTFVSKIGRCHMKLVGFEEFGDSENGRHIFKYEILAHKEKSEQGTAFWEYCTHPSGDHKDGGKYATSLLMARAVALGLTTMAAIETARKDGRLPSLDFSQAVGTSVFCSLKFGKKYEDERRVEIGSVFALSDPRCKSYPRNPAFIPAGSAATSPPAATSEATAVTPENDPFKGA